LEERREQFECSYCGQKFNFKKDAEDHEETCPSAIDLNVKRSAIKFPVMLRWWFEFDTSPP
jgi:hypothetical protein